MAVRSPCVEICRLDRRTGWCVACLRSIDEIRAWPKMTDHRRHEILRDRARRERKLGDAVVRP